MATPDLLSSLITSIQPNCAVGVFQSPMATLISTGLGEAAIVEQLLAANKSDGPCYVSVLVAIGGGTPYHIAYLRQIPKYNRVDNTMNLLEGRALYLPENSILYVRLDGGPSGGAGVDAVAPYAIVLN